MTDMDLISRLRGTEVHCVRVQATVNEAADALEAARGELDQLKERSAKAVFTASLQEERERIRAELWRVAALGAGRGQDIQAQVDQTIWRPISSADAQTMLVCEWCRDPCIGTFTGGHWYRAGTSDRIAPVVCMPVPNGPDWAALMQPREGR